MFNVTLSAGLPKSVHIFKNVQWTVVFLWCSAEPKLGGMKTDEKDIFFTASVTKGNSLTSLFNTC